MILLLEIALIIKYTCSKNHKNTKYALKTKKNFKFTNIYTKNFDISFVIVKLNYSLLVIFDKFNLRKTHKSSNYDNI